MLNPEQILENKETFKKLILEAAELKPEKKGGLEKLLEYLEKTDFYTAPASSKFHQNYEGGLVEHTLSVFNHLEKLVNIYGYGELDPNDPKYISRYSMIVSALFHDFCKINRYEKYFQGHYMKDANGKDIIGSNGKKQWVEEEAYRFKQNQMEMGHAMRSLFVVSHFIILTEQEASAIAGHMGEFDTSNYYTSSNISTLYTVNKLAYLLHIADMNDLYI